jgi:predicted helicase
MNDLQDELYKIFLKSPTNLFDDFILECQKWYEAPAHSFSEMRMRDNKKVRGDIFEEFCVLFLKFVKGHKNVWLLKDVPDEILVKLNVARRDMGIDIIVETTEDTFIAVQCKYKKHTSVKQNILSWKSLSTFYALCLRTGPWEKYIIMTNCVYTRHQGKKTKQDISYCLKTLQNITKDEWLSMCNTSGEKLGAKEEEKKEDLQFPARITKKKREAKKPAGKIVVPSNEEMRVLRTQYYTF